MDHQNSKNVDARDETTSSVTSTNPSPRGAGDERVARKRTTELHLAAIVQSSNDAIISVDLDGIILTWNPSAERMFGFTEAEVAGKSIAVIFPPELRDEQLQIYNRVRDGEHINHYETVRITKAGKRIEVSLTLSPLRDVMGRIVGISGIDRDITEHKGSGQALLRRLEFEKFLFDLSRTFIGIPEEKVDVNMERGLAHVGQFLEMDRVTLLELSRDRAEMAVAYSWSAPGVMNPPPLIAKSTQPWWVGQILRGEVSLASHVDDLPEEAASEKEYLRERGVASAASIPLRVGGEIAGAISFVTVHRHVSWTDELVNQLRAVGDILWNALKRRQAMQALLAAERATRESEERFRLMTDTAPVMVWMSAEDALCQYFNRQWLEFTGRPLEAELGNGWMEGVHPADFGHCLETYLQAFDRREPFRMEYRLRRDDGNYRWILDSGVPRFKPGGSFAGYIGSAIDITDQKLAQEALSNLSQKLMQVQEQERAFIARELHDDLAQRATALALHLQTFARVLPGGTSEHARVQKICDLALALAKAIPALSHRLHSAGIGQLGIAAAAATLCKELSEQYKVQIDFGHQSIPEHLSEDVAICLFRVLQEALNNAIRHSGSREFQVSLHGGVSEVELIVHDTGIGFDPEETVSRRGLGLTSMRERLKLVDGQLSIDSTPGRGTRIYARVPVVTSSASVTNANK